MRKLNFFLILFTILLFSSCDEESSKSSSGRSSVATLSFFSLEQLKSGSGVNRMQGDDTTVSSGLRLESPVALRGDFNEPLLRYYKCYSLISGMSPNPEERIADKNIINYLKNGIGSDKMKHEVAVNACIDLLNLAELSGDDSRVELRDSTDSLQKSILRNINNFHQQWFTNGSPFTTTMNGVLNHHESFPGALRLTHNLLTRDSEYKNILRGRDSFFGVRDHGVSDASDIIKFGALDRVGQRHSLHFPDLFIEPDRKNSNTLNLTGGGLDLSETRDEVYIDYSVSPKMMRKVFRRDRDSQTIELLGDGDTEDSDYSFSSQTLVFNLRDPIDAPIIEEAFAGVNTSQENIFTLSDADKRDLPDGECTDEDMYIERGELIGIKTKNEETCVVSHYADRFLQPDGYETPMFNHPGAGGALDLAYLLKNIESSQTGETLSLRHTSADRFARRWARYLLLDYLCLDIPNLSAADSIDSHRIDEPQEGHTFIGNTASCMTCHSSIDPLSRAIAPIRVAVDGVSDYPRYDNRGDDNDEDIDYSRFETLSFLSPTNSLLLEYDSSKCSDGIESACNIGCVRSVDGEACSQNHYAAENFSQGRLSGQQRINRLAETIWPSESQEDVAIFLSRAPMYGEVNINDVDGNEVRDPVYSYLELGQALTRTKAYYACAAKRYFEFFVGEKVDLFYPNRNDSLNPIVGKTELEEEKLKWIIERGEELYAANITDGINLRETFNANVKVDAELSLDLKPEFNSKTKVDTSGIKFGLGSKFGSGDDSSELASGDTINDFQKIIKEIISSEYFMESILGSSYSPYVEYESLGDVHDYYANLSGCFGCHEGLQGDVEAWAPSTTEVDEDSCQDKLDYLKSLPTSISDWKGVANDDQPLIDPGEPCNSRLFTVLGEGVSDFGCTYEQSNSGAMEDYATGVSLEKAYDLIENLDDLSCPEESE